MVAILDSRHGGDIRRVGVVCGVTSGVGVVCRVTTGVVLEEGVGFQSLTSFVRFAAVALEVLVYSVVRGGIGREMNTNQTRLVTSKELFQLI